MIPSSTCRRWKVPAPEIQGKEASWLLTLQRLQLRQALYLQEGTMVISGPVQQQMGVYFGNLIASKNINQQGY